jgi:hypothetical protein
MGNNYKWKIGLVKSLPVYLVTGRMSPDAFGCVASKDRTTPHVRQTEFAQVQFGQARQIFRVRALIPDFHFETAHFDETQPT